MRVSPRCGVSTRASGLSKVAAAADALFASFLLLCERKKTSRQAVARNSTKTELQVVPQHFETALPTRCLRVSVFCIWRALRQNAATGCSHDKNFSITGETARTYSLRSARFSLAVLSAVQIKTRVWQ